MLNLPRFPGSVKVHSENYLLRICCCLLAVVGFHPTYAKPYFQQDVKYHIKAKLDDQKQELLCSESITYQNNSPDTLAFVYLHLWPNAYADDATPLAKQLIENGDLNFYYSKAEEKGHLSNLKFSQSGAPLSTTFEGTSKEICKLNFPQKLAPGDAVQFDVDFQVKLPSAEISRLGYIGQSYMISQWYPKPAVYDNLGWHPMPYLDQGEFYSEYGDYEVEITLPSNYICAASGILKDEAEFLYEAESSKNKANAKDEKVDKLAFPQSDSSYKTLHFEAKKVHDFAWFADKRFTVLTDTIELPYSHRKILARCYFTNAQENYWRQAPEFLKNAVLYYSEKLGDYPYPCISIVDGTISAGGGMEYPGISLIGRSFGIGDFEYTIHHEVGHNWFQGILGSNERDNPWMDEGMNSYYNLCYFENRYPHKSFASFYFSLRRLGFAHLEQFTHKTQYILSYWTSARQNQDQPINLKSTEFTYSNYGNIVYSKTAFCMNYLRTYLGQALMDSCMRTYYERWKFKHPQPSDFRAVVEEIASKDLSWFFDGLIASDAKLDYKISRVKKQEGQFLVTVKNKGNINGPLTLQGVGKDANTETIWSEGFSGKKQISFPLGNFKAIELDADWNMPEIKRSNNRIRCSGIFKKVEPLQLQFVGSVERMNRSTINYFPAAGYTSHDGLMGGLIFYNLSLIQKPFEYCIMPLYALSSNTIAGYFHSVYHFSPKKLFRQIDPQLKVKRYSYRSIPFALQYNKIAPSIDFILKKRDARSALVHKFSLMHASIWEDEANYSAEKNAYVKKLNAHYFYLNGFRYLLRNNRSLNPFELNLNVEQGETFVKSWLEGLYHFSYERRNKAAEIRLFAGKFLYKNRPSVLYGFSMNGNNDYAYENIYLGRNDTRDIYNQQFYNKDGAFKNLTLTGNSLDWLLATNIFIPAPDRIPLAFYSDIGKSSGATAVDYDFGIALVLFRNIFEIYAPIQQSADLNQLNYFEKIRFVLHFNAMNPFEQFKNLIP